QILELFGEDSWRNVYAGELEVRPPGAPTIGREAKRSAVGKPLTIATSQWRLDTLLRLHRRSYTSAEQFRSTIRKPAEALSVMKADQVRDHFRVQVPNYAGLMERLIPFYERQRDLPRRRFS